MKVETTVYNSNPTVHKEDKLKSACIDFETIFISKLLNGMRKTINKSGFIDGGIGEEIFTDMLYDEYAQTIAKQGGFGLADMIYKNILSKNKIYR